jgi:hypothetical protein
VPAIETLCARCGGTFVATRRTTRFCSERCRRADYADRRRLAQATPLVSGPAQSPGEVGERVTSVDRADSPAADSGVAESHMAEQSQPEVGAQKHRPFAAVGSFIVIPYVMFALGLLLAVLGQLVAGVIEVVAAVALFSGFYIWGARQRA